MNITVTKNQVTLDTDYILNDKEYKVNTCNFTFSSDYTDDLVKKAIFIQGTNTIEVPILNNTCQIPYEVLNQGTFELHVYAYEVNEGELILRYSPSYTTAYVRSGSYVEGASSGEEITPTQFETYMQALNDGLNEVANVDIDAEQTSSGASITITDRSGQEKTVIINNGTDGTNGRDATINGINTLNIVAGDNIEIVQEEDTLTINATGGGSGGTTDYNQLSNKPQINNVTLSENKSLSQLGIQPAGNYALSSELPTKTSDLTNDSGFITEYTETDPTVPSHVKNITQANITSWNNKSDFSGNYNDLSNKPTIPTKTSDLTNDSRFVNEQTLESSINDVLVYVDMNFPDISGKENTSNKVTSLSSSSTDTQYPSAKCVYDIVGNIETVLTTFTTGNGV